MPALAPRKSSLGARRGLQKAHIPYRGDNPEVGKKTGIAVQHVERKSDGFEPFEEIMQQADKRTPPKPKGRKGKQSLAPPVMLADDFDENGEMSMELDSPAHYFTNAPPPVTPTSYRTSTSSARPVSRTSDVDFDEIPSPRRGPGRKSLGHRVSRPGSSRLSESYVAADVDEDDPMDDYGSPEPVSPQHTSFAQMDQDDDDGDDDMDVVGGDAHQAPEEEPEEEEELPPPVSRGNKGKERAKLSHVPEEPESEVEDEIAQGLENVEERYSDDDDDGQAAEDDHPDPPEPSPRQKKKAKITIEEPRKPRVESRSRSKKENRPVREGVRKSARSHYKPLEWWRGEKLVYGRREDEDERNGPLLVAPIKEIRRIPREEPEPLGKRKRGLARYRSKSKVIEEVQIKVVPVTNPEEGWDDETDPHCVVNDYTTKEEVERRVAWTTKMLKPEKVTSDDWSFQKVFGDADFIAAGVLVVPARGRKPSKATKDNTYVFYIIEGAINLKIHETSLVLTTGSMFIVPRGNTYFIENISERDAKLFFTQARKVAAEDVEAVIRPTSVRPQPAPRSSSVGAVEGAMEGREMSKAPAPRRAASTRA